jgi:signal transduction histidine kinase
MQVESSASPGNNGEQYGRRFAAWHKSTTHPGLVLSLLIVSSDERDSAPLLRMMPPSGHFAAMPWPSDLEPLRSDLLPVSKGNSDGGTSADGRDFQNLPADSSDRSFAESLYSGGALSGWQFEPKPPALLHRLPAASSGKDSGDAGWLVIILDRAYISDHLLPDLAQRYFRGTEGLDYQVAVFSGTTPRHLMYSSDGGFGSQPVMDADGTMNIFGRIQNSALGSPIHIFHAPSQNKGLASTVGISWFPLLGPAAQNQEQDWHLVVRHRRGGALGAFVQDSRQRDLAISFGVLFLLVVSMAILIVTTTRAQHLAKLQMDFVTAVSHELRTPLTVISSAADNIAHGVVEGKEQLEQYGSVIGSQARKLFEMVEQILLFAAIREGHQRYTLRPLKVSEVIDAALSSTADLIKTAAFSVDLDLSPNMPLILGDFSALSQCLQNLITNALKYGSGGRCIGIKAQCLDHGLAGKEVQISVSDRGIGIDASDLPHIFEPFYRSPSVAAAQIHGTGLGLPLAMSIAEAMEGSLTVQSALGRGSTFTIHLPCEEPSAHDSAMPAHEAVS